MKIKTDKIALPPLLSDDALAITSQVVQANEAAIQEYISAAREHLEGIKTEIYKVVDAGYRDAEQYRGNSESTADFSVKPSVFLETAYTVETFDDNGKGITNRVQEYIDAGTDFSDYCDNNASTLTNDELLSNDAGKMIGSINSALSQLNRIEASFVKAKTDPDEYELAGGQIPAIQGCIDAVLGQAEDSKLVKIIPNQNFIEKALSGLSDIVSKIGSFFSNLGKSQEQQNIERFTSFKNKYRATHETAAATEQNHQTPEAEAGATLTR